LGVRCYDEEIEATPQMGYFQRHHLFLSALARMPGKAYHFPTMKILVYPHEVLSGKAKPVERLDGGLQQLIDNMFETMYGAQGVGLAANQIGELIQLVVMDVAYVEEGGPGRQPLVLINPRIVAAEGEDVQDEGCLSVPNYTAPVRRATSLQVKGYDREGKEISLEAGGLLARCIQHELDHLLGICFVDRMNPIRKALFRKKWPKIRPGEE
jgi:peptide deformylase